MKAYGKKLAYTEYVTRCCWFVANQGEMSKEPWQNFWKCYAETDESGKAGNNFQWETVQKWNWEMVR